VNTKFYIALLIFYLIYNSILNAPSVISRVYLQSGLLAIPIGLLLAVINIWLLLSVYNRFPKFTMVEINRHLCGKYVGGFLSILHAAMFFCISFIMFRAVLELILEFLMPGTPVWFLAILLVTVPISTLLHTDRSLLYLMTFFTVIACILLFFIFWMGIKELEWNTVQGLIVHTWKPPSIKGIAAAAFVYGVYSCLAVWNPYFARTSIKKSVIMFSSVGLIITLCGTIIPLAMWGPWAIKNLNLIWVMTAETFSIDLFIIERGVFLILPLILLIGYMGILLYAYKGYRILSIMYKKKMISKIILGFVLACYVTFSILIKRSVVIFEIMDEFMVVWVIVQNVTGILWYVLAKRKERGLPAS
jgi:hypothetical protein